MSCTYVPESFKNNLRAALNALGNSTHKFHCAHTLQEFLRSMDPRTLKHWDQYGYVCDGVDALMRLFEVANYRAFRLHYKDNYELSGFQSFKHRFASRPTNYSLELDYALIVRTLKAVNYLIYHCQEDGQVKCEDRKMFEHFENLRAALTKMMIENSPEYQAAQWGEFYDLDWHQRY